jgi:CTP-dependent riboflavin kinase
MKEKTYLGAVEEGGKSSTKWMPQYIPQLFPGTLNVRLQEQLPDIHWEEEIDTHYGEVCRIAKCKINNVNAYIINPPEVFIEPPQYLAEIGHEEKLREKLDLKDGDLVVITLYEKD